MPLVKLKTPRVRWVPEDPRVYVNEKAGDEVECDAATGHRMTDAGQAEWVGDVPARETEEPADTGLDDSLNDEPVLTNDSDDILTDLPQLGLEDGVVTLLMTQGTDDVPAFESINELDAWISEGGDIQRKIGIGAVTKAVIIAALDAFFGRDVDTMLDTSDANDPELTA